MVLELIFKNIGTIKNILFFALIAASLSVQSYVGGAFIKKGSLLPMVGIGWSSGGPYCSGAFISPKMILTAAHCIVGHRDDFAKYDESSRSSIQLTFNDVDNEGYQIYFIVEAKDVYLHPDWPFLQGGYRNADLRKYTDIAILELEEDLVRSYLALENKPVQRGQMILVGGFGMDNNKNDFSRDWGQLKLERKFVQLFNGNDFGVDVEYTPHSMLAPGDSGGAVLWKDPISNDLKIVGVNSMSQSPGFFGLGDSADWFVRVDGPRYQWAQDVLRGKIRPTFLKR